MFSFRTPAKKTKIESYFPSGFDIPVPNMKGKFISIQEAKLYDNKVEIPDEIFELSELVQDKHSLKNTLVMDGFEINNIKSISLEDICTDLDISIYNNHKGYPNEKKMKIFDILLDRIFKNL